MTCSPIALSQILLQITNTADRLTQRITLVLCPADIFPEEIQTRTHFRHHFAQESSLAIDLLECMLVSTY